MGARNDDECFLDSTHLLILLLLSFIISLREAIAANPPNNNKNTFVTLGHATVTDGHPDVTHAYADVTHA